jgi:hypothetical protein
VIHPFLHLQKRQDLSDCCRNLLNLFVQQIGAGLWRAQCGKCGRKHTKMYAEGIGAKR